MLNALFALVATALLANAGPADAPADEVLGLCDGECRARVAGSAIMAAQVPAEEAKDAARGAQACAAAQSATCAADLAAGRPERVVPLVTQFQTYLVGFVNAVAGLLS